MTDYMGGGPATYYGGEAYEAIVSLDPNGSGDAEADGPIEDAQPAG